MLRTLLVGCLFSAVLFTFFVKLNAQSVLPTPYFIDSEDPAIVLYDDSTVPRIDILINPDNFNQLFENPNSDTEFEATFIFNNGSFTDTVEQIGFGLKGNTSLGSAKKSFKISFNTFTPGNKYKGIEKINLNGEHNDPAIIRSKLFWDMANKLGLPAPRANHVALYVNDLYMGLYINVEHIDEEFAQNRFGNNDGNLYKCLYPATLENLGTNGDAYKIEQFGRRVYELQTNEALDDYSDLAAFVTALHQPNGPDYAGNLDAYFNIDGFLRVLALDIFSANWDGYSYNINNYYLYHNIYTGKFEYIPYDTDNTFGVDWFGIDWATRNVYNWTPESNYPPLTTKILNIPEFRKRFSYYFNVLLQTAANPATYFPQIDAQHALITPFAEADIFRTYDYGFTIADFNNSYTQAWGAHVTYGIKPYITARRNAALSQLTLQNIAPVILGAKHSPELPVAGQNVQISAIIFDDDANPPQVSLHYRINGSAFTTLPMQDNGTSADGLPNDGIFGAVLTDIAAFSLIEYYITASDAAAATNREPLAETAYKQVFVAQSAAPLVINEFMASNSNTIADEFGEYNDWVEIYNTGTEAVNLGAFFLTDDLTKPNKWQLPDTLLGANAFILIWADGDEWQGPTHASFKLSASGEQIGIFGAFAQPVYTLSFGPQQTDLTQGLLPDGIGGLQNLIAPTPGYSNMLANVVATLPITQPFTLLKTYANPFVQSFALDFLLTQPAQIGVMLYNKQGQQVFTHPLTPFEQGQHTLAISPPTQLPPGIYFAKVIANLPNRHTQKISRIVVKQ